jgi:hypothetical protein
MHHPRGVGHEFFLESRANWAHGASTLVHLSELGVMVRKYIGVGLLSLALITGQAIAAESADSSQPGAPSDTANQPGAPSDSDSSSWNGGKTLLVLLLAAGAGVGIWELTKHHHEHPASP